MDTPRDYTNELMKFAEEYSKAGEELAKIQIGKASAILVLMATSKSIKEAELKWQATEPGKQELILTYKIRGLKEIMSASKTRLRTLSDEKFNHY